MKQALFLAVFALIAGTGVYTVITLYDTNLKAGRMYQTPVVRPHEEPELLMDKRAVSQKSEARTRENLANHILPPALPWPEDLILATGKKEYTAFCAHCHGPRLDGLGTVGQSFFPLPTDLTGEKAVGLTDKELFTVISYGSKKTPALASSMSVESREAVIQYLRFMQKTGH
ncbi:MAG: cytochrome c [Desulfobacula sp.]|nr:cytochrome c [Desulfobacula sp.]